MISLVLYFFNSLVSLVVQCCERAAHIWKFQFFFDLLLNYPSKDFASTTPYRHRLVSLTMTSKWLHPKTNFHFLAYLLTEFDKVDHSFLSLVYFIYLALRILALFCISVFTLSGSFCRISPILSKFTVLRPFVILPSLMLYYLIHTQFTHISPTLLPSFMYLTHLSATLYYIRF